MNIAPIQRFNIQQTYAPSFYSNERKVYDKDNKKLKWRNTTYTFRSDLNWYNFAKLIQIKYQNEKHVNTFCYGCSDGSEPYSLYLALNRISSKDKNKFLPIIAKDIDPKMIEECQSGYIKLHIDDIRRINKMTKNRINDYFGYWQTNRHYYNAYTKPELMSKIRFSQANILYDIDSIPAKNNVIMCRNFWPYLKPEEQINLADKLGKKLDSSSIVVIGAYDTFVAEPLLKERGFSEIMEHVYIKQNKAQIPWQAYQTRQKHLICH